MLLAADGLPNVEIAARVGVSRPTVTSWRARYERSGIGGLADQARSGRPRIIDHRKIVAATLRRPPKKLGVTHWSSRLLATHLGIGDATVARAWREYGLAPWRCETFKFSTDPQLVAKITDVVGLYLAPPENAVVLCVDEKSQIQALVDQNRRTDPDQSRPKEDFRRGPLDDVPVHRDEPGRKSGAAVDNISSPLDAVLQICSR